MDLTGLEHSAEVRRLLQVPMDERDGAWVVDFFAHVPHAAFVERGLMAGPDGFAYLALQDPPEEDAFRPVTLRDVVERCTDEGIGVVLNPQPAPADWVFHYGTLWSFRAFANFLGDPAEEEPGPDPAWPREGERRVVVGAPDEVFLPPYARRVIARFLRAQGIERPRVALVDDPAMRPSRALAFDIDPKALHPRSIDEVLRRLTWFLPPKRTVLGYPRDVLGPENYVDLD